MDQRLSQSWLLNNTYVRRCPVDKPWIRALHIFRSQPSLVTGQGVNVEHPWDRVIGLPPEERLDALRLFLQPSIVGYAYASFA